MSAQLAKRESEAACPSERLGRAVVKIEASAGRGHLERHVHPRPLVRREEVAGGGGAGGHGGHGAPGWAVPVPLLPQSSVTCLSNLQGRYTMEAGV